MEQGERGGGERADVGIGPYEDVTSSLVQVRAAGLQEVRGRAESPSHGFAVPAPFRQGGQGDGGTDCHSQCAHWLRNDMVFHGVRCAAGHMGPALQPNIL